MTAGSYNPMMPWSAIFGGFLGIGAYAIASAVETRKQMRREGYRSAAWFAEARLQVATVHEFFAKNPLERKTRAGRALARRCRVVEAAIARAKPMPGETP